MTDTEQPPAEPDEPAAGQAATPQVVHIVALARARAWSVLTSFVAAFAVSLVALVYTYQSDQQIARNAARIEQEAHQNDMAWCTLLGLLVPPGAPSPPDPRQQAIINAMQAISRQFGCPTG